MQYDLFLTAPLNVEALATALGEALQVPAEAIDVAADGDAERDWTAPVLVSYDAVGGDLSFSLSITSDDNQALRLSEPAVAARLAELLNQPVLYPAVEPPPSAYWLADGVGRPARARLYQTSDLDPNVDDDLAYTIETVDRQVPALPDLRVGPIPEVIREHRLPTPLSAGFAERTGLEAGTPEWHARTALGAWESFVTRMTSGWPPDGWYPADYYAEDLRSRDDVDGYAKELSPERAGALAAILQIIDESYERSTVPDGGASLGEALHVSREEIAGRGPRWQRRPTQPPWVKG